MTSIKFCVSLIKVVLAASLIVPASGASGEVFRDDFNDNSRSAVWNVVLLGSGPSVDEINQRVEVSLPGESVASLFGVFMGGYSSLCQLRGDFDIQVDYELLVWPPRSGVRVGLVTNLFMPNQNWNVERTGFSLLEPAPGEMYLTDFTDIDGVQGRTPTGDLFGKLRQVRTGGTVTGYYFADGSWIPIHSAATATTEDRTFAIVSWGDNDSFINQTSKVLFDNFVVSKGKVICPAGLLPCAVTPEAGCRTAAKSLLLIKQKGGTKDRLTWKWTRGQATSQAEFGDPTTTTDYTLCVYANNSLAADAKVPADGTRWKAISTKGYKYKDSTATEDGIQRIVLRGSDQNKAKAIVRGKGANLPDPTLPLELPVTVQLQNSETGVCWEATYVSDDIKKNEADQFKAKAAN